MAVQVSGERRTGGLTGEVVENGCPAIPVVVVTVAYGQQMRD